MYFLGVKNAHQAQGDERCITLLLFSWHPGLLNLHWLADGHHWSLQLLGQLQLLRLSKYLNLQNQTLSKQDGKVSQNSTYTGVTLLGLSQFAWEQDEFRAILLETLNVQLKCFHRVVSPPVVNSNPNCPSIVPVQTSRLLK